MVNGEDSSGYGEIGSNVSILLKLSVILAWPEAMCPFWVYREGIYEEWYRAVTVDWNLQQASGQQTFAECLWHLEHCMASWKSPYLLCDLKQASKPLWDSTFLSISADPTPTLH